MSNQEPLHKVWEMTDKAIIDMLKKKPSISSDDSGGDSSDTESIQSSCRSFVAVPKEFRPCVSTKSKEEHNPKTVLNGSLIDCSNQKSNSVFKSTLSSVKASEGKRSTSLQSNGTIVTGNTFQNKTPPPRKSDIYHKENGGLQKCRQAMNTTATVGATSIKNGSAVKQQASNPTARHSLPYQKQKMVFVKKSMQKSTKNGLRYNCTEKQECSGTIQVNFQMPPAKDSKPSSKDELEYNAKFVQHVDLKKEKKLTCESKDDFSGVPCGITHHEKSVKWDNNLTLLEGSDDDEEKIEWKIIQEKKTVISARRIKSKKNTSYRFTDKYPIRKSNDADAVLKTSERPNKSTTMNNANVNSFERHGTTSKQVTESSENYSSENPVYRRNIQISKNVAITSKVENNKENRERIADDRHGKMSQQNIGNYSISQTVVNDLSQFNKQHTVRDNIDESLSTRKSYKNFIWGEESDSSEKLVKVNQKELEDKKALILHYGRELSDLIIGSHTALSVFISFYREWKNARQELISYFQQLENDLTESSKKYTKYEDIINAARTAASLAAALPIPHVSLAAKVVSLLTGLFSAFLPTSDKNKSTVEDTNNITMAVLKTKTTSVDLYIYGLQCHQQFKDTVKVIEEFHLQAGNPELFEAEIPEMATFLRGMLEYKPNHHIFYKKLHKCFQDLIRTSTSDFSKRFCEPFTLHPSTAVDVIGLLKWRFRYEDFNGQSVQYELEHLQHFLGGNSETSIKELVVKIQNCIRILRDELEFLDSCVKDVSLFDICPG